MTAHEVEKTTCQIIYQHGCAEQILSDLGSELNNEVTVYIWCCFYYRVNYTLMAV